MMERSVDIIRRFTSVRKVSDVKYQKVQSKIIEKLKMKLSENINFNFEKLILTIMIIMSLFYQMNNQAQ